MPIYEYQCEHCGVFEEMQRITDPPLTRCPTCKRKVRRLISNTSFQLKGSGWYATDYARSGSGNGAKKDSGETAASSGKSEKTSEKAADAKPAESKPASEKSTS
jgi:putative FmdB family regulatory protein